MKRSYTQSVLLAILTVLLLAVLAGCANSDGNQLFPVDTDAATGGPELSKAPDSEPSEAGRPAGASPSISAWRSYGDASGQSNDAFTVGEFTVLKNFTPVADSSYTGKFKAPAYADVTLAFGKPSSQRYVGSDINMTYGFGTIELRKYSDGYQSFKLTANDGSIEGPRGTKVGDSCEQILKRFKNDLAGELPSDKADIYLYEYGDNPYYFSQVFFQKGQPTEILYQMYNKAEYSARVCYEIADGKVNSIIWELQCP